MLDIIFKKKDKGRVVVVVGFLGPGLVEARRSVFCVISSKRVYSSFFPCSNDKAKINCKNDVL